MDKVRLVNNMNSICSNFNDTLPPMTKSSNIVCIEAQHPQAIIPLVQVAVFQLTKHMIQEAEDSPARKKVSSAVYSSCL